jgi:hypothetical protein
MCRHTSVILLASILFFQNVSYHFVLIFFNFYCISRMTFYVQHVIELSRMIFERQQKPGEGYGENVMLFVSVI